MLDTLGDISDGKHVSALLPPAFIQRVRGRKVARRVRRATMLMVLVCMSAGAVWMTSHGSRSTSAWTYTAVQWPPTAPGGTGGPVRPLPAGIRPDSARAIALLQ